MTTLDLATYFSADSERSRKALEDYTLQVFFLGWDSMRSLDCSDCLTRRVFAREQGHPEGTRITYSCPEHAEALAHRYVDLAKAHAEVEAVFGAGAPVQFLAKGVRL